MAYFARDYHLSPDLLPWEVARRYGITTRPMSPAEIRLRQERRDLRGRLKPYLKPLRDRLREVRRR